MNLKLRNNVNEVLGAIKLHALNLFFRIHFNDFDFMSNQDFSLMISEDMLFIHL